MKPRCLHIEDLTPEQRALVEARVRALRNMTSNPLPSFGQQIAAKVGQISESDRAIIRRGGS